MIYQRIDTAGEFAAAMYKAGRGQFSFEALETIFDFYEDAGTDIELDPVSVSCEWSEVEPADIAVETGGTLEDLYDNTFVYELSNGNILYLAY